MDTLTGRISNRIKKIRERLELSQEDLAKRMGISRVAVSQIENGHRKICTEELIGATYIKNHYGPTPKEFIKIVKEMEGKDLVKIQDKYFQYPQTKYMPLKDPNLSKISAQEQKVIDDVLLMLSDMNATKISEYSHNDVPWMTTEEGDVIDYESVFYRTAPYSMREYSEEETI